jgi:uncharacterized membrane protein
MRVAGAAVVVCLASWFGLLIGAGATGLQRSVSAGPSSLLERPLALVLVGVVSLALAFVIALRLRSSTPLRFTAGVIIGDLLGAVVLAPVLVGELSPAHAPIVFVALIGLGVQPLAALVGFWAGQRMGRPSSMPEPTVR